MTELTITGPITYEVRESPHGAILVWWFPTGSGGSCQFPDVTAAKRYAKGVECGDRLQWTRVGKVPGMRRWVAEVIR